MTEPDPRDPNCFACRASGGEVPVPGGLVYENECWRAEHCVGPLGVGSIVVKTKVHRESLWELTPREAATLGPALRRVSEAIVRALSAARVYVSMWVDEPPYHVHFVLQPRYPECAEQAGGDASAALGDLNRLLQQAADRLATEDVEALGAKGLQLQLARVLRGTLSFADAEQASRKVRDYLADPLRAGVDDEPPAF